MPRRGGLKACSRISVTRSKSGSTSIRARRMSMMQAFSIPRTWAQRSDADVATEHFLVAEIRDAGADGAGDRGAARLRCDPAPDQRNPFQCARRQRETGVFG